MTNLKIICLILIIQISYITAATIKTPKNEINNPKTQDLLDEIQRTFENITLFSIDGQPGSNEAEKYYSFYENVQYYLKLKRVANKFIDQQPDTGSNADFKIMLKRKLKSIETRINQDSFLSSFTSELTQTNLTTENKVPVDTNVNFEIYEDFIKNTQFGRYYAKNITMISDSLTVFNQICSHLSDTTFPGNLTRPSKQYEMVRGMSFELYLIKSELFQQINPKVLMNREDVKNAFARLTEIVKSRPYIRMLGDQFSSNPPYFSSNVRLLTSILDLYLTDSLTRVSFYNQLSDLPEDFILLGANIAREYEKREVPLFTKFNPQYYGWPELDSAQKLPNQKGVNNTKQSALQTTNTIQDKTPFFVRLFT